MQLGWIDFSKNERNKVLSVIHQLEEPAAVDELGLGAIRDGFADYFFPGTSTVQTRAKYFLIVPYILKEAGSGEYGSDLNAILKKIDNEERGCRDILIRTSSDGIIGGTIPNSWVLRTPLDIYWNGIKRVGIFKEDLSVKEYLLQSMLQRSNKNKRGYGNRESTEEHNRDDYDAGDLTTFQFWSLGNTYQRNWRNGLTIELLPQEASFLRNQVIVNQRNTLFAYVLKNNISLEKYESFGAFTADLDGSIGEELQNMIKLANDFNNLASLITTRYNLIVSCGRNRRAIERWGVYSQDYERRSSVDLLEIFHRLGIRSSGTKTFLLKIQDAFNKGNIDKADEMIIARESNIKRPSRAKTNHAGEYPEQQWIGAFMYDYRFTPTKRIVADIMNAEVLSDV